MEIKCGESYLAYKDAAIRANREYYDFKTWMELKYPVSFAAMDNPLAENNVSNLRKATPVFSGFLRYFPHAVAAAARLSKAGNDKHNPGQPLHWSREKSNDHGDCLVRHQLEFDQIDPETGEYHAVAVFWRAAAQLELLEEKRSGK